MKSIYLSLLGLIISIIFISCSKDPADVLEEIKNQQNEGNYDNIEKYYTAGTVKALDELDKLSPKGKSNKNYEDKKFAKGTDWKVINEKIEDNNAEVTIKYTAHPVENMKGLELTFRFQKENGEWKIDMEKELRVSLDIIKMTEKRGKVGKQELLNKMKEYME